MQAHPSRSALARSLASTVGADVVFDPDPEAYRSPWRTFRRLLETTPPWASHRAQIQDDATGCEGLAAAVDLVVAARPDHLILLYVGGRPWVHADRVRSACSEGRCFADLPHTDAGHWTPCVSTVWPAAMIPLLLEYVDGEGWPPEFNADDEIVGRFVRACGVRVSATVPSLVQHPDHEVSLRGTGKTRFGLDSNRVAALYVGNCGCDPLMFNWEAGLHDT